MKYSVDPLLTGHGRLRRLFFPDGLDWLGLFAGFAALINIAANYPLGPNVEAAMVADGDFPGAPNSLALTETPIEHIMGADIAFGPMTLGVSGIVAALDEEAPDIIRAVTAHHAIGKGELKFHPMTIARAIIVKSNPWP